MVDPFETDVGLRDGSIVHVRPVRVKDRSLCQQFVENLSSETRYLRFTDTVKPEDALNELIPGPNQFALLALREKMVIGHAIYTATIPNKAEPAVVVADAYQGQGLGTILR